jgi:hypothetical protein
MTKAFKAFFLARQLREKLLLLAFVGAAVAIWFSSFAGRARVFWLAVKSTNATLATQADWIGRSDSIDARTRAAAAKLDPLKTYNANSLLGVIDRLAKEEFGNKVDISTDASKVSGQFATHSVVATIRASNTEADWGLLNKFYFDLQKLSPYVRLDELMIQTTGATRAGAGGQMTVRLHATSIEVIRKAD